MEPDAAAHGGAGRQQAAQQSAAAGDPLGQLGEKARQQGRQPASTGLTLR